jgi:hypothetical protein
MKAMPLRSCVTVVAHWCTYHHFVELIDYKIKRKTAFPGHLFSLIFNTFTRFYSLTRQRYASAWRNFTMPPQISLMPGRDATSFSQCTHYFYRTKAAFTYCLTYFISLVIITPWPMFLYC